MKLFHEEDIAQVSFHIIKNLKIQNENHFIDSAQPMIVSNSISLNPQQHSLTMFELFCLTKGKSLVVKCKINFHTKILIRVLWIVGMEILVTSQFVNKKSFQFHEPFFKVWLQFLFLLKIQISFSIEISLSKKLWKFQNLIIGTLKLSFYLFSHSIEYSPKENVFVVTILCFHSAIHIYDNNNTFYSVCNRHSRFSMNKQKRKNQIHLQVLISAKISFREEIKKGKIKRNWNILSNNDMRKKWLPQVNLIRYK